MAASLFMRCLIPRLSSACLQSVRQLVKSFHSLIMAVCVAVMGKDNSPQFIGCSNPAQELQFQYQIHASLDVIDEKLAGNPASDLKKLYLGLLHATDEHKVYGYMTNTKIKFVLVVESSNSSLRDNDIQTMFARLHTSYVDIMSNPFYIPGDPLTSQKFQSVVTGVLNP